MHLYYCFEPDEGTLDEPTNEEIKDYIQKLRINDFLIFEESEDDWIQVKRIEDRYYQVEYFDKGTWAIYEAILPVNKVIEQFIEFAEYGIDLQNQTSSVQWMRSDIEIPKKETTDLEDNIITEPDENSSSLGNSHSNGYEFEEFIAKCLNDSGWETRLTKRSGDQGLDVLAFDDTFKVALQCKRYANPVGNDAVQQAHAAADFIGATHAAVISTSTFTSSAKNLAEVLGVILIQEEEIKNLRSHVHFISPRKTKKVANIFKD